MILKNGPNLNGWLTLIFFSIFDSRFSIIDFRFSIFPMVVDFRFRFSLFYNGCRFSNSIFDFDTGFRFDFDFRFYFDFDFRRQIFYSGKFQYWSTIFLIHRFFVVSEEVVCTLRLRRVLGKCKIRGLHSCSLLKSVVSSNIL